MSYLVHFMSEMTAIFLSMAPYLLLGLTIAGFLHVVFRKELIVKHLGRGNLFSIVKAALLGVPLPLCSCGVVPTALSLRKNNASEGATLSFLISTPQTGIDSIIAMYGLLGGLFALFTPVAALVTGVIGGIAVTVFKGNKTAEPKISSIDDCNLCTQSDPHTHSLSDKIKGMFNYAYKEFLDDISLQLVAGILISAVIGFVVPENFFSRYVTNDFAGMVLMVLAGIPLYICATASIPIALVLMIKGLSPGAAFVFLTVGPATNAATITMIAHAMGRRVVVIYLTVLTVMSFLAGSVLNMLYAHTGSRVGLKGAHVVSENPGVVVICFSILFGVLLLSSITRKIIRYFRKSSSEAGLDQCKSGCSCGGAD